MLLLLLLSWLSRLSWLSEKEEEEEEEEAEATIRALSRALEMRVRREEEEAGTAVRMSVVGREEEGRRRADHSARASARAWVREKELSAVFLPRKGERMSRVEEEGEDVREAAADRMVLLLSRFIILCTQRVATSADKCLTESQTLTEEVEVFFVWMGCTMLCWI